MTSNPTRRHTVTATLAAAIGLAALPIVANAAGPMPMPTGYEKCYGIAAAGRNDCAAGAHSCAGQATRSHDPASFVFLPKGACSKIAGGKLSAA